LTNYKLNGIEVEKVAERSINNRRWWAVKKSDGSVEIVLYRELDRSEIERSPTKEEKNPGYTIPADLLDRLSIYSPSQIAEMKRRKVKDREKAFWIVQNKAKEMTGKSCGITKSDLRRAEEELNRRADPNCAL
jgi:hypothetical protein